MKAPMSKKIKKILSGNAGKISITAALIKHNHNQEDTITLGNKKYKLERITYDQK